MLERTDLCLAGIGPNSAGNLQDQLSVNYPPFGYWLRRFWHQGTIAGAPNRVTNFVPAVESPMSGSLIVYLPDCIELAQGHRAELALCGATVGTAVTKRALCPVVFMPRINFYRDPVDSRETDLNLTSIVEQDVGRKPFDGD